MAWAKLSFAGGGAVIVKLDGGLEFPPPGGGVKTATLPFPPTAISLAPMATVIWLGEHGEANGVWGTPRKETVEPTPGVVLQLKPVPFTCRLKPGPPALALLGTSEVIMGAAPSTLKRKKSELTGGGPGSTTVIWCTPTASRLAGITAVRWFASTNVVVMPFVAPFHCTCEVAVKWAPSILVSVTAPEPAGADVGRIEDRNGPAGIGRLVS